MRIESVDLAAVIGTAIEAARPLIEAHKHTLTVELPSEAVALQAEPVRLSQVFTNLLTNAAKYTRDGGSIHVAAAVAASGLTVRVRDNGIGISAKALPHIFHMFSESKSALECSEGGLGIGLALVRGLLKLHGGTITASSGGEGRGNDFNVHLPTDRLTELAGAEIGVEASTGTVSRSSGIRVLVADDNADALAGQAAREERWIRSSFDQAIGYRGPRKGS